MDDIEYQLHFMCDRHGHPTIAWLARWQPGDTQGQWLADVEFGPFDTRWDLAKWLVAMLGSRYGLKVQ